MNAISQAAWVCVLERDLHAERTPAKIFINLARKHVLKMKNKQMYKHSLRKIHYVHLQMGVVSMWETAQKRGMLGTMQQQTGLAGSDHSNCPLH